RRKRPSWQLQAGLAPEATRPLPFHPMPRALQNDPRWQETVGRILRRELFHRIQRAAPSLAYEARSNARSALQALRQAPCARRPLQPTITLQEHVAKNNIPAKAPWADSSPADSTRGK